MTWIVIGLATAWGALGLALWLCLQLLRQNGRILLRLESLQTSLESLRDSLAHIQVSGNGRPPPSESKIRRP